MILFVFLIFHCIVNCCVHSRELTGVVETNNGPVQGEIRRTFRKSIAFSSFRGIRYGKAPTGSLRFKPPEKVGPWSETLDATVEGNPCPQLDPIRRAIFVDEDCLNLNVYSPRINFNNTNDRLLAVMVWIYGGSFVCGNIDMQFYGPDFLIENGVVVVAMNYRLGVLGFLSLNLPGATGNAGLKDQRLALKWVQENIEHFGGDPSSVTIFGQSAGAASVDYHVLFDSSKGLFHRSISMSGSPLCLWAFSLASQAEARAFRVGKLLGINTTDKGQLLKELRKQSSYDLIMATEKMNFVDPPFKPTLEDPYIAGDTAFLSECSVRKYKSGNFMQVPSITGYMASEALTLTKNFTNVKDVFKAALNKAPKTSLQEAHDIILHSHNVDLNVLIALVVLTNETYRDIITLLTDVLFVSGIDTKQRYLTQYSSAPVYYYRNSFAPYSSSHRFFDGINENGAAHADDLAYCWYMPSAKFPTDLGDPFVVMQDRISRMWTNFAKYSDPTPLGKNDSLLNISWPVSGLRGLHLEINDELSVGERPIDRSTEQHESFSERSLDKINGC